MSVERHGTSGKAAWIAPDDALPEHPSVVWRKRNFSKVALVPLTDVLDECQTELWLLTPSGLA